MPAAGAAAPPAAVEPGHTQSPLRTGSWLRQLALGGVPDIDKSAGAYFVLRLLLQHSSQAILRINHDLGTGSIRTTILILNDKTNEHSA
eukprot:4141090-Pleurochrysis_carterae.AAC.2